MRNFFTLLFFLSCSLIQAQGISKPNFAFASHPMVVDEISFTPNQMIIKLTIENQISGGNFCVDKNIYIKDALTNTKLQLSYSENIPVCPEIYDFKWVGEKLSFKLFFPKPSANLKYIDIVEVCSENCFTIKGIIIDAEMNKNIDLAFEQFANKDYKSSKITMLEIIDKHPDYKYGFLHLNLIQVLWVLEEFETAREHYQIIQNSNFADKPFVLDQLNKLKIFN